MKKFKTGDKVRRIKDSHCGMIVGDVGTVANYYSDKSISLQEYRGVHDSRNFKLVSGFQWGEEVEVKRWDSTKWELGTYVAEHPKYPDANKHIVHTDTRGVKAYEECRKTQQTTELTIQEIADKFGLDVGKVRIKD